MNVFTLLQQRKFAQIDLLQITKNSEDLNGRSYLTYIAMNCGDDRVSKEDLKFYDQFLDQLIRNDTDLNEKDSDGNLAIMVAVMFSQNEILEMLIQKGGNINAPIDDMKNSCLMSFAAIGKIDSLTMILNKFPNLDAQNSELNTALMIASINGESEAVELIISYGANPNLRNSKQETPLMHVVINDDVKNVENLVKAKADMSFHDLSGKSALSHALGSKNNSHMIRKLVELGADVNLRDPITGVTPLMWAIAQDEIENAVILLDLQASPNVADATGKTALSHAITRENHASMLMMLNDYDADVNAQDPIKGRTALMWAALYGNEVAIDELILRGVDVHAVNKKGSNALMHAAVPGYLPVVSKLLDANSLINHQNHENNSILDLAVNINNEDLIELLVKRNADINHVNSNGHSTMSKVIHNLVNGHGDASILTFLAIAGADLDFRDGDGDSLLHLCALYSDENPVSKGRHVEIAKLLIHLGVDLNQQNLKGETPLNASLNSNSLAISKILLDSLTIDSHLENDNQQNILSLVGNSDEKIKVDLSEDV